MTQQNKKTALTLGLTAGGLALAAFTGGLSMAPAAAAAGTAGAATAGAASATGSSIGMLAPMAGSLLGNIGGSFIKDDPMKKRSSLLYSDGNKNAAYSFGNTKSELKTNSEYEEVQPDSFDKISNQAIVPAMQVTGSLLAQQKYGNMLNMKSVNSKSLIKP